MISFASFTDSLKSLLEAAKDVPTEKIATIGLIILGAASIIKSRAQGYGSD